jgi:hemolysin D
MCHSGSGGAAADGVAQEMAVTTVGQVVTTGQQLIVVAPLGGKPQVEALVANLDIGFVKLGEDAVIKVDAFPFTRFGALRGKVVSIASAAIAEQDAKRALANATATANVASEAPSAPGPPESFVFPVTARRDRMKIGNAIIPLATGMTVIVRSGD